MYSGKEDMAPAVSSNVYLGQKSSPTYSFVTPSSNTSNGMPEINKYLFKIQLFPFCFQVQSIIFFSAVRYFSSV